VNSVSFSRFIHIFALFGLIFVWSGCSRLRPTESQYLANGKSKLVHGDYARAILDFKNAAQLAPRDPEPFYQMAEAYESEGDLSSTVACLRKAIQLNPKHSTAQAKLAELLADGARGEKTLLAEAEQHARAALAAAPDAANPRRVLALTMWQQGKTKEAVQLLQETAANFPRDLDTPLMLARIELAEGRVPAAEQALQRAAGQSPGTKIELALADLYLHIGRIPQAEGLFRSVIKREPKNAQSLLGLAVVQVRQGKMEQADQTYQQIASLPGEKYHPLHALFLLNWGRRDAAISELERLIKEYPKDQQISALLVSTYLDAHRTRAAEQLLTKLLKKNPKNNRALLERAKLYLDSGKLREAQLDLDQVLHLQPDSAEAHYLKAKLQGLDGQDLNRRQELAETLRLSPTYLAARIELAQLLLSANSAQSALDLCNSAPESQRKSVPLILQRNRALLALGNLQKLRATIDEERKLSNAPELALQDGQLRFRQRDFAGARADAKEVLSKQPDDIDALNLLASTYTVQKQIPAAIEAIRNYAATRSASVPVQQFLAQILAAHGDLDRARQIFNSLRSKPGAAENADLALAQIDLAQNKLDAARERLAPLAAHGNSQAILWLATVDMRGRRFPAAMDGYRKVLASDPTNVPALNNLAFLLAERGGNPAEALKFAQQAAERAPDHPDVQGTLAIALYRNGVYQQAKQQMEAAVSHKDNAIRRYYLSLIDDRIGDPEQSRSNLKAAMRLDPNVVVEMQNR